MADGPHQAGVLAVDFSARSLGVAASAALPGRPHGLLAAPDGGMWVLAAAPGRWLLRLDAQARVLAQADTGGRMLSGHALASRDGRLLYTPEIDAADGRGRIVVRDARSLVKQAEWDSGGVEPRQLVLDAKGHLLVAHGGIRRDAEDRKLDLPRMASALLRLNSQTGAVLGQWKLDDPRLSIRHLAWSADGLLGVALQAEHEREADRSAAPALAIWDTTKFHPIPGAAGQSDDIAGVPGGGFVITQRARGEVWWWHPAAQQRLIEVARLEQAGALASGSGVLIATARGLARWHPRESGMLQPWPAAMQLGEHMAVLARAG